MGDICDILVSYFNIIFFGFVRLELAFMDVKDNNWNNSEKFGALLYCIFD